LSGLDAGHLTDSGANRTAKWRGIRRCYSLIASRPSSIASRALSAGPYNWHLSTRVTILPMIASSSSRSLTSFSTGAAFPSKTSAHMSAHLSCCSGVGFVVFMACSFRLWRGLVPACHRVPPSVYHASASARVMKKCMPCVHSTRGSSSYTSGCTYLPTL